MLQRNFYDYNLLVIDSKEVIIVVMKTISDCFYNSDSKWFLSFTKELLYANYRVKYWAYCLGFKQPWSLLSLLLTQIRKCWNFFYSKAQVVNPCPAKVFHEVAKYRFSELMSWNTLQGKVGGIYLSLILKGQTEQTSTWFQR